MRPAPMKTCPNCAQPVEAPKDHYDRVACSYKCKEKPDLFGVANGTCLSDQEIANILEVPVEKIPELITESECERCCDCGWFVENCEMNENGQCNDCAGENDEE